MFRCLKLMEHYGDGEVRVMVNWVKIQDLEEELEEVPAEGG